MRIYFDENFSPHLVAGMQAFQNNRRSEDVTVFWMVDEFGRGAPDETWIPAVAKVHGVALTQDTNIHRTKAQWDLCKANKIGVFFQARERWLDLLELDSVSSAPVARNHTPRQRDEAALWVHGRRAHDEDQKALNYDP